MGTPLEELSRKPPRKLKGQSHWNQRRKEFCTNKSSKRCQIQEHKAVSTAFGNRRSPTTLVGEGEGWTGPRLWSREYTEPWRAARQGWGMREWTEHLRDGCEEQEEKWVTLNVLLRCLFKFAACVFSRDCGVNPSYTTSSVPWINHGISDIQFS